MICLYGLTDNTLERWLALLDVFHDVRLKQEIESFLGLKILEHGLEQ